MLFVCKQIGVSFYAKNGLTHVETSESGSHKNSKNCKYYDENAGDFRFHVFQRNISNHAKSAIYKPQCKYSIESYIKDIHAIHGKEIWEGSTSTKVLIQILIGPHN